MTDRTTTPAVIDVDEASFEREVLERSKEVPVVVDFWAAWCAPCRSLGPVLEKLATEAGGSWMLAKVDVDANPRLAQAAGVQGIPAVRAFREGKQVAEFTGALPEPEVRRWLTQLGPSPADEAVERARAAEERGDLEAAAEEYRRALDADPGHADARAELARVEAAITASTADTEDLARRLTADPDDVEAAAALAAVELGRGDAEAAFGRLLEIVERTEGEVREAARSELVSLLETLPTDDPRATAARRRLARALY